MSDTPQSTLLAVNPDVARALLVTVAETINNVLVPQLNGGPRDRALDCFKIVSRLATGFGLSDEALHHLAGLAVQGIAGQGVSGQGISGQNIAAALAEGRAVEAANRQGLEEMARISDSPVLPARTFDGKALEACLRRHPLGGENTVVTESRLLAGGRSKVTAFASQQGAKGLPGDFVVRQDWENAMVGTSVSQEFAMLQTLFRHGIKVPEPFLVETSRDYGGAPFMVVARQWGGNTAGNKYLVNAANAHAVRDMGEQLAKIHTIPAAEFRGLRQQNYSALELRESLAQYRATIAQHEAAQPPLIGVAMDWLEMHAHSVAVVPPALVHGDIGVHNVLYDDRELTSILDWETAHIGNPAYDLGYLRNVVTDDGLWSAFMARYTAAGGHDFDTFIIDYYGLFSCVWFYQIGLRSRAAFCAGRGREIEIGAVLTNTAPQSLATISRILHRVLS